MRTCVACGAENPAGARFCVQCGSPLGVACHNCGADLPPDVRFCPACGAAVEEPAPRGEERKLVTVLFCDVAGSTGLGERLDPEHLKEVMGGYFDAMRAEIEAEGGTVEKFIGDAVMAVFGAPVSHEDDPARALRAALRMRGALERLNRELDARHGVTLGMRTGVNTGQVVADTVPVPHEGLVAGDAVNAAARLEQSAEPGQVLVGERTVRGVRGFRFREVGPLALKGKEEPVRAFELLGPAEVETAQLAGAPSVQVVGRQRELALLDTLYHRVVGESRPHLVTIYGEAGVGKSRLVEEFALSSESFAERPRVMRGRCVPYGAGIAYRPLAEIMKTHAGVLDSDDPATALGKVRDVVGGLLARTEGLPADPSEAVAGLAFTVGLDDPDAAIAGADPRLVRVEVHRAWRAYFTALARTGPVVAIVQDIHWADPALLELLEDLAEHAEGPVLFLCPARPELTARHPEWGGGRWNFSGLLLEPLREPDAGYLLDLLAEGTLPAPARARILERAGGNPFFIEEIVRRLADEGPQAGADVPIPDTVQGVLAARIDLLQASEKRALQYAAVVGRTFWSGLAARLLDRQVGEVDEVLARLEERGLVAARLASTMAGEREYAFRHVLTRDVAYESLPRRERAAAHAEVAAWTEERASGREREFADLLAYHCGEALRGALEQPGPDRERTGILREQAFGYALLASEEGRRKLVLDGALRHAEAALSLAHGNRERALALEALGQTYFLDSQGDLAWRSLKEAVDLRAAEGRDLARLCASALEVATRLRGAMRARLTREEVQPYLDLGLASAGEGDGEERARLLVARSFWPYSFRDLVQDEEEKRAARDAAEVAAAMALRLGRPVLASAALDGVGSYYLWHGLYGELQEVAARRLALVHSLADPAEIADAYSMAAWAALHVGRYAEAHRYADEGYRAAASMPVMELYLLDWRAMAHLRLGDWDEFDRDVERIGELLGERRDHPPGYAADHVAATAYVSEVREDAVGAERALAILDWLEEVEERPSPGWALWRSRLLARRGSFDEARAALEGPKVMAVPLDQDQVLEGHCELAAASEDWDRSAQLVTESREHAARAGSMPLPLFADRLEGLAAFAAGDHDRSTMLLARSADGFRGLGAQWEAAVSDLALAEVLAATGDRDQARSRASLGLAVFERLRARRELLRATELLSS